MFKDCTKLYFVLKSKQDSMFLVLIYAFE